MHNNSPKHSRRH